MPELRYITESQMREFLRESYSRDREKSFLGQLARHLRDPVMPRDANNDSRVHPLWLTLGLIVLFALSVFLYFSAVTH
jgi:hypothetical protein